MAAIVVFHKKLVLLTLGVYVLCKSKQIVTVVKYKLIAVTFGLASLLQSFGDQGGILAAQELGSFLFISNA